MVYQEGGKLGVPLHCVSDLKGEGGGTSTLTSGGCEVLPAQLHLFCAPLTAQVRPFSGGFFFSDPHKISFTIKPMYENSQPPERFTLSFPRNAKEDRDRVLSEMQRVLREKTWQPAPVVNAPEIAAPAPAPAQPVAPVVPQEADRADADGISVVLPGSEDRGFVGGAVARSEPVPPPQCGFKYDFALERAYVSRSR